MDCTCDPVAVLENIRKHGPHHVVIKESGYVVPLQTARALYDVSPDIVLIRKDGVTFGAPLDLSGVALCRYPDYWLGFVVDGSDVLHDMRRWQEREQLLDAAHGKETK